MEGSERFVRDGAGSDRERDDEEQRRAIERRRTLNRLQRLRREGRPGLTTDRRRPPG